MPTKLPGSETIVVGAGSAGAALAARLVERGRTVTLLDAGPDWRSEDCLDQLRRPSPSIFAWKVDGRTPDGYYWPDLRAARRPGREPALYLRGRGLGGTSTINGLVVVRPPLEEFDDWADGFGCAGWRGADVLPYFCRLEDDLDFGGEPYHGRGGPTPIVRRPESDWGSADELLAEGATALGHAWEPDYNAPGAFGVSPTAMNIRMGVRVTTNDGYLEPLRRRPQLRVVGDALVDRVLVAGGRAVGVRVRVGDAWQELHAEEVVLCAGAAGTPAILQRSGIGPAALLRRLEIPVVADLPVGAGIQDHVGFWLSVPLDAGRTARNGARGNCTLRWSSGNGGAGDLLAVSANPLADRPDEGALGVKLAQCFSRGSLAIASRDPDVPPAIQLNLLEDRRDRILARRALRDALELLAAAGVRTVRDREGGELSRQWSDGEVDAWLVARSYDTAHLSCGASMGAVTDTVGRVLGVDGLRVADMSLAPTVPRANTHLTAVMLGERIAAAMSEENVDDLVDQVVNRC